LCSSCSAEFRAARELATDITVRPYLIALGYLLGEFTDFQHLGNFNRLYLAHLVFGAEAVETAMDAVAAVADRGGNRGQNREDGRYRLPGVLAQAHRPAQSLQTHMFMRQQNGQHLMNRGLVRSKVAVDSSRRRKGLRTRAPCPSPCPSPCTETVSGHAHPRAVLRGPEHHAAALQHRALQ
jgi:hypothetical protein